MRSGVGVGLLQTTVTVGGIAVALAAFSEGKGPKAGGVRILVAWFVLAGLVALIGGCYAGMVT